MAIHLLRSRRDFLKTTFATGGVVTIPSVTSAADPSPNDFWALVADTHIAGDPKTVARGVNMFDQFNAVVDDILAETQAPAGVIINGDCAYLKGLSGDYSTMSKPIRRLTDAGLPVHMTMGNHDSRGPFYNAFDNQKPKSTVVRGKHVSLIEGKQANLFLLDSLQIVDHVTGELGEPQLKWLHRSLKQRQDKPAIIFGHHNPQFEPNTSGVSVTGLADTSALMDLMHAHDHVQAYFFGHTHNWKLAKTADLVHLVNQPPSAYVFQAAHPSGWVRLEVEDDAMQVELRSLDPSHSQHGERHSLEYRFAVAK